MFCCFCGFIGVGYLLICWVKRVLLWVWLTWVLVTGIAVSLLSLGCLFGDFVCGNLGSSIFECGC